MSCASALLAVCCLLSSAADDKPDALRFLREVNGKFLPESEITTAPNADGTTYTSRTDRGKEVGTTTLTLRYDAKDRLETAEIVQESPKGKKTATLKVMGKGVQVKRGGLSTFLKIEGEPIVTTAPDWSDVFQLVRRYDRKAGKRQDFPGVWFHPEKEPEALTYSIDLAGTDNITLGAKAVVLDRFKVKLRSGDYLVWADSSSQVVKLLPLDRKGPAVVLKGYEDATRELAK